MSDDSEPRDVSRLSGSMESPGRLLRIAARRAFVASASRLNSPQAQSSGVDDPAGHGGRSDAVDLVELETAGEGVRRASDRHGIDL